MLKYTNIFIILRYNNPIFIPKSFIWNKTRGFIILFNFNLFLL